MFIYFNIFITLICGWLILYLNSKYLQPALLNKKRFKLFTLRDKLSLLAMKGDLSEDSLEYREFIHLINSTIKATSTFRVTDFLKYMYTWSNNPNRQKNLQKIYQKMKSVDNYAYCEILSDYFSITQDIFDMQTRILRHVFFPILTFTKIILSSILSIIKPNSELEKDLEIKYKEKTSTISEIDKKLNNYRREFHHQCAI